MGVLILCLLFQIVYSEDVNVIERRFVSISELASSNDPVVQVCRSLGTYRDPTDCARYIICRSEMDSSSVWRTVMERNRCPFGIFDTRTQRCNWPRLSAPCDFTGNSTGSISVSVDTRLKPSVVSGRRQKPVSYTSELSGLQCLSSGYFAHPRNSSKFYRCVAVDHDSFMVYLFSCEKGLTYEGTVRACVKSIAQERLETGVEFELNNTKLHTWEIERCHMVVGFTSEPFGIKGILFRNPLNCRRFFRCSGNKNLLTIEHFSCPTGLFFDADRQTCTWASEIPDCPTFDPDMFSSEPTSTTPRDMATTSQAVSTGFFTRGTIATRWFMTTTTTVPSTSTATAATVPPTTVVSAAIELQKSTLLANSDPLPSNETDENTELPSRIFGNPSPTQLANIVNPPTYLTATGVLVTNPNEFLCKAVGTFPSGNICFFFKCEKYDNMDGFLTFRFQCPPHTSYSNGTCAYSPKLVCSEAVDDDIKAFIKPSEASVVESSENISRMKLETVGDSILKSLNRIAPSPTSLPEPVTVATIATRAPQSLLCLREGIFPIPFSSSCSTRFMQCRRLTGPLHFFVSLHECPPSLIFSRQSSQCLEAVADQLDCPLGSSETRSSDAVAQRNNISIEALTDPLSQCKAAGFVKTGCRKFRRCELVARPDGQSVVTWIKYDFECPAEMVFDAAVSACIHPSNGVLCMKSTEEAKDLTVTLTTIKSPPTINLKAMPSRGTPETTSSTTSTTLTASPSTARTSPATTTFSATTASTATSTPSYQPYGENVTEIVDYDDSVEIASEALEESEPSQIVSDASGSNLTTEKPAGMLVTKSAAGRPPVCQKSGYFLYPDDSKCQRFYRCLQLTPEPSSFVMLHYRCDDGFVFDSRYFACSLAADAPPCDQLRGDATPESTAHNEDPVPTTVPDPVSAPVKVLPQVWQLALNESEQISATLVCTRQQVYRLATCGYYYSCIKDTTKGKFRLEEIFCETLFYDQVSGTCIQPPPGDPCHAAAQTRFSSIWSVRKPTLPTHSNLTTTMPPIINLIRSVISDETTQSPTQLRTPIFSSLNPVTFTRPTVPIVPETRRPETTTITSTQRTTTTTGTTSTSATTSTTTTAKATEPSTTTLRTTTTRLPQLTTTTPSGVDQPATEDSGQTDLSSAIFVSNPAGNSRYVIASKNRIQLGTLIPGVRPKAHPASPPKRQPVDAFTLMNKTIVDQSEGANSDAAVSYRNRFNELYAQLVKNQEASGLSVPTTQSALMLNFNTISGQSSDIRTGVSFQCRSEGYFRNSRDLTCSKFYLCVKVGPRQYNLFEFMCLPRSGIQWKYDQTRNQCVDPGDVNQC